MAKEKELDFTASETPKKKRGRPALAKTTNAKRTYTKRADTTDNTAKIWAAVYNSKEASIIRDAFNMGARTRELFTTSSR